VFGCNTECQPLSAEDEKKVKKTEQLLEKLEEEQRFERRIPHWSPRVESDVLTPTDSAQPSKILFTPGPLTTSYWAKSAALHDYGSRDHKFIKIIKDVCDGLLDIAGVSKQDYTTIPMQGSGTFGVEGVFSSVINKKKGVLIIANGSYGTRMKQIAKVHGINHTFLEYPEDAAPNLQEIEQALETKAKEHSHVAIVHSETTSGIINDIEAVGKIVHKAGKSFIVDAMSSFGATPIDFEAGHIDYLVSSANKCIEGVPGFSFIIARKTAFEASKGNASTLSLDIHAQRAGLDQNGQFRFTPPTHAMAVFARSIQELKIEGGVQARMNRYKYCQRILQKVMDKSGFQLYLKPQLQGHIISSYRFPKDPNWNFEVFYDLLNHFGFVIYPGKVSNADCFRIGHIGRIFPSDTRRLADLIAHTARYMKTAGFYSKNQRGPAAQWKKGQSVTTLPGFEQFEKEVHEKAYSNVMEIPLATGSSCGICS
jgi:2-aminoethylphosphonate-pyruvate transaminase